jgi:ACR3 family arsenite efflux pump ArsB
LRETQQPEATETAVGEALPAPQGIGMAVAFDWGLTVQIFLTPITVTLFKLPAEARIPGVNPTLGNLLLFVVAWPVAGGLALFGEMVRRGRNWARRIQIVANALLSLVGIAQLFSLYQSIRGGNFWPVVTEVILVIFSPLIFWRLTRPSTARWFKMVTVTEARKRHGGAWPWFITIWAIVGGVLQTIAAIK